MATATLSTPLKLADDQAAIQELRDGLGMAAAALNPPELDATIAEDRRWDDLCDVAIANVLPHMVAMLDAAIAAEWERAPITP